MSMKAASKSAGSMAATLTGWGSLGVFVESLVLHRFPWIQPGVTTAAVATLLSSAQSALIGWWRAKHPPAAIPEVSE